MSKQQLLIFLKYPTPGQVKTRLAAALGDAAAADVYRTCVESTLRAMQRFRQEAVLWVAQAEALEACRRWLGPEWNFQKQQGDSLGERLIHATAQAFAQGAGSLVVIGTDSPWLNAQTVEDAFRSLRQNDVVLGPSEDGGYYLIGLSRHLPGIFENIAWSTANVYRQTLENAKRLGLFVESLAMGYDVDTIADLDRFLLQQRRVI